ncbi:hypothetical protein Y1Q_0010349 [Alligator mississippiensis]|uniref:Uncharacterized protein n=1 Tax=Alligator mississippiensis TaxID=8496 RepID=A0A151NMA8_ALLMI|nr:hypothetical protein Y1Q_0010349 [Alligator mississippiensis]
MLINDPTPQLECISTQPAIPTSKTQQHANLQRRGCALLDCRLPEEYYDNRSEVNGLPFPVSVPLTTQIHLDLKGFLQCVRRDFKKQTKSGSSYQGAERFETGQTAQGRNSNERS